MRIEVNVASTEFFFFKLAVCCREGGVIRRYAVAMSFAHGAQACNKNSMYISLVYFYQIVTRKSYLNKGHQ